MVVVDEDLNACSCSLSAMLELKSWGRSLLFTLVVIWMRYMVFI